MSDTDTEYGLLVKFYDDSESFTNGFEAGMIWQQMVDGVTSIEKTVHLINKDVIEAMAAAMDYETELDWDIKHPDWASCKITKRADPVRPKFRVIDGGVSQIADGPNEEQSDD